MRGASAMPCSRPSRNAAPAIASAYVHTTASAGTRNAGATVASSGTPTTVPTSAPGTR
jgi:hypothetical protein